MVRKRGTEQESEYVRRLRLTRELSQVMAKMDGIKPGDSYHRQWINAYDKLKSLGWPDLDPLERTPDEQP